MCVCASCPFAWLIAWVALSESVVFVFELLTRVFPRSDPSSSANDQQSRRSLSLSFFFHSTLYSF